MPYPHCIRITSPRKVKLWEENATAEAIGMQREYILNSSSATRGGGWAAKVDCRPGVR